MRKMRMYVILSGIFCATVAMSGCRTRSFNSTASASRQEYDYGVFIGALASSVSATDFPVKAHSLIKAVPDDELLKYLTRIIRDDGKPENISPDEWNMIKMAVVDYAPDSIRDNAMEGCRK